MPDKNSSRVVTIRRTLGLTTAAAAMSTTIAAAETPKAGSDFEEDQTIILAQADAEGEGEAAAHGEGEAAASGEGEGEGAASGEGEGESEGGGSAADPEQALQRDMSFMEGHLRAGLALYEAGDLEAAKTHMGHPIEEKYDAVAEPLAELGFDSLRGRIESIAAAAESEADFEEVKAAYDEARATMEEVRSIISARNQVLGLAMLTRVAGDEYTVAVEGGKISNLHEYQDSWGFLRVVETEATQMSESDDEAIAAVGKAVLESLSETEAAYGDIQGEGEFEMDSSILYGAAAQIELAGLELE